MDCFACRRTTQFSCWGRLQRQRTGQNHYGGPGLMDELVIYNCDLTAEALQELIKK